MPDLADLEALVRATRPVPDPAWAARLDSRAARGFPDAAAALVRAAVRAAARATSSPLGALASVLVVLVAAR